MGPLRPQPGSPEGSGSEAHQRSALAPFSAVPVRVLVWRRQPGLASMRSEAPEDRGSARLLASAQQGPRQRELEPPLVPVRVQMEVRVPRQPVLGSALPPVESREPQHLGVDRTT